jgi:hypothetical protein
LFSDYLESGPIFFLRHEHYFESKSSRESLLKDHFEIILSRSSIINKCLNRWLNRNIENIFKWRHHITRWDLHLWKELPFKKQVLVLDANLTPHPLTQRLKIALKPFSCAGMLEDSGSPLSSSYEGHFLVFNALNFQKDKLTDLVIQQLQRYHSHVLVCLYHEPQPWHELLKIYTDRLICIHVAPMISQFSKLKLRLGFHPKSWCCDEDIEAALFQILHERPTSSRFSLGFQEGKKDPYSYLQRIKSHYLKYLFSKYLLKKDPQGTNFTLKTRAFKNVAQWLAIYKDF